MKALGSLWFKSIAASLILTMLCYDVTWASPLAVSSGLRDASSVSVTPIPAQFGRVDEILTPRNGKVPGTLIYHLQDAHAVYEAQSNLAGILEALIQKEGISLVLVEGGSGNVSLTSLRRVAWKTVRRKVSDEFLREGKISGEEYLQVASNYPFELIGIEDESLYRRNLEVFLRALRRKREANRRLTQIESHIRGLEANLYPAPFRELERMRERWREGEGNLLQYLLSLDQAAHKKGIDTTSYAEWHKLSSLEKGINPSSFDQDDFFSELTDIESKVRGEFLADGAAKEIWQADETLRLLKSLFNFELTSEDYGEIRGVNGKHDIRDLAANLERVSGNRPLGGVQEAARFLDEEKALFLEFYELAVQRDQAFLRNIERILKEKQPRKAVLITGGFHSRHLGELFKEKGISRVLISPGITALDDNVDSHYEKILREKSRSALRAPATLGTPYFTDLKGTLEREQSVALKQHVERLIGFLDVDEVLEKKPGESSSSESIRSELREIHEVVNMLSNLSSGTAAVWGGLAGLAVLGTGYLWHLHREKRPEATQAGTPKPAILSSHLADPSGESLKLSFENEDLGAVSIPFDITSAARSETRSASEDPAKDLGREAKRFFEGSFPVVPSQEDLPPPPYELPLPIPADAIPQNQDARGKVTFILQEVLQAMETMDGHMRSQQKESAERALRKVLEEDDPDPEKYRQYLGEDLHQFFLSIQDEIKKMNTGLGDGVRLSVSEEIEESYPRFPRLVKHLLSEQPELLDDAEIKALMSRISGKFTARPPVAPDIAEYVEQTYKRLKEQPVPPAPPPLIAPTTVPNRETPAPARPAPKRTFDPERINAQLRDLERMHGKLEGDRRRLDREIQKVEGEKHELMESLDQARADNDRVIADALQPSVEAYEGRLQKLRTSRGELAERLNELNAQAGRLRALLEDEGGGNAARSEMRVLIPSLAVIGGGLVVSGAIYLIERYQAHKKTKALIDSNKGAWQFERARVYKETVPLRESEKLDLFKNNDNPLIGLGVFAGWVIGGFILYHAYHSWDWASTVLFEGVENQGKKEPITLGPILWLLEIFGAPFIGALLGVVAQFFIQTTSNFTKLAYRALRFPFDYHRAVRLHLLPYESLSQEEISKSAKFLSRMEKETLEVMLQNWVERGEHEKIKAFSEKGTWKGKSQDFIQLYEDVAGLEQAKALLINSFTSKEEHKEAIGKFVKRWKTLVNRKGVNGAHVLKDLIPMLADAEKSFKGVRTWMERLIEDPVTPWKNGVIHVIRYYEISNRLDQLKADIATKFNLTEEDKSYLDSQLQSWLGRIPEEEQPTPDAYDFLRAALERAFQVSQTKAGFSLTLRKISEIAGSYFRPSKQGEFLAMFDQVIGYEMIKGRLLAEADPKDKETLTSLLLAIEAPLGRIPHPATIFTEPFTRVRELPAHQRLVVLQDFHDLDTRLFNGDPKLIGRVFDLLIARERARSKLLALGDDVEHEIRQIESKAVLKTMEDLTELTEFYSLVARKEDSAVQRFVLNLTARAPPSVSGVFIRSREPILSYYLAHRNGRDYGHLGELAESYRRRYGSLEFLTETAIDHLTDAGKPDKQRIEETRKALDGQKLIKLGYPINVIETRDAVSIDGMMSSLENNSEDLLRKRAGNAVVKNALARMGRFGLYSYWESSRPAYYLQFLEEVKGIDPAFFRPGEKIRVAYDGDSTVPRKQGSFSPVTDPVREMKSLVTQLRLNHPNIYENFIAPKRELLNGKPLEDVIDEKSVFAVAKQFKSKAADWPFSDKERIEMLLRVHEVLFSRELQPLLGQGTVEEEAAYWKEMLRLFGEKSGLKKDSDLSRSIVAQIKRRIDELVEEAGTGRDGVVQFILTRGTVSDFVRGEISEDCCAEHRNLHFNDTVGLPTDPAFLSFKLVENGKWIGNIYSIVLKDQDGKFVFYLDNMPVRISHPVTTTQAKADKLVNGFYQKLKELLEVSGFDYFVTAPDPSSRENIRNAIRALGGESQAKATTKPGGFGQKTEFGVSAEYIQGLGTLSSSISANGKWITLDNRAAREKRRQLEIQELQKSLRAADTQRKQLEKTKAAKATQVGHLKERSQEAEDHSKAITAQTLQTAAKEGEVELSRIVAEISALEGQMTAVQAKLHGLNGSSHASRSEMRVLSTILALFNPANGPLELLLFLGVTGLLGWIGWELIKGWLWGDEREEIIREPETNRLVERETNPAFMPAPMRPVWFEHPLVMEISDLFKVVLRKVSREMKPLIPRRLFFPIPPDFGMRLSEKMIKTLSTARTVLGALRDHGSLIPFMSEQNYYKTFKERTSALGLRDEFDAPGPISTFHMQTRAGKEVTFSLELSDRTADDLLKGDVSHDCTGLGACAAFYETIPQFLLDPGFLNIKLRMDGKWVGNIYLMVGEKEGRPALVIDAVQLPPAQNAWPIHPTPIAQAAVNQVVHWAREQNFERVFMSSFGSNFTYLYDYFNGAYPREVIGIAKLGGFEHLKELGLWDSETGRNQYIETFSAHWNEPLENVDQNRPDQNLYLRPVWDKTAPPSVSAPSARSEMRTVENWTIEGIELETPGSDLKALGKIDALKGVNDQDILTRAFQSRTLKIPDAFREAGFEPGMKVRVRVHDDDEEVKRVYKFIMVIPEGRRNFVLEVGREKAIFWRPYTENLNLIDTALMAGRENGKEADLRDIFRKHGEPTNPALHEIPAFGTIYAHEKREYWDTEKELKVFDLQIKGNENPSIRIATLPASTELKDRLPKAKAEYDFEWGKRAHFLLVYSLQTDVRIRDIEPEPKAPELSQSAAVSPPREDEPPPESSGEENIPVTPIPPDDDKRPSTVDGVESTRSTSGVETEKKTTPLPKPAKLSSQDEGSEETPLKPTLSDAVSSVAQAAVVGLGAQLAAQAKRMASNVAQRKIEEKVSRLREKIAGYRSVIDAKVDEIKAQMQSLDLEITIRELLEKMSATEMSLRDSLDTELRQIQTEIEQYRNIPELASSYESLQEAANALQKEIDQQFQIIAKVRAEKIRQKAEYAKSKMQHTAEAALDTAAAIYGRIQAVSLDLSPQEILDQTKALETELVTAVETGIAPLGQEVESFNLDELKDIHAELAAFSRELQQKVLTGLEALESEESTQTPTTPSEEIQSEKQPDKDAAKQEETPLPIAKAEEPSERDLARSAELDKEISSKESHLASTIEELDALRKETQALLDQIGDGRQELESLERKQSEVSDEIESLQSKRRELETQTENLEETREQKLGVERQVEELDRQLEGRRNDLQTVEGELTKTREEHEKSLAEKKSLDDEMIRKQEELESIEAEKDEAHAELEKLHEQILDSDRKADALSEKEARLHKVNRELEEKEVKLAGKHQQLEEANELLQKGQADLKTLTDEIENERKVLRGLTQSTRDLQEQISGQNRELESLRGKHSGLADEIKNLTERKQALEEELSTHKAEKDEAERTLNQLRFSQEEAKRAYQDLLERNSTETVKLEALRTQITEADQTIREKETLLQDLAENERERTRLLEEIAKTGAELESKREALNSLSVELSEAEENSRLLREEKETLLGQLEEFRRDLESLENLKNEAHAEYDRIQEAIIRSQTSLDELPAREKRLVDVSQELVGKELALKQAETALKETEQLIEEKTTAVQSLDRELASKTQSLQAGTRELEELATALEEKTETVRTLDEKITSIRQQTETLEAEKSKLEMQLKEAGSVKAELEQTRRDLQEAIRQKEEEHADYEKILRDQASETSRLTALQREVTETQEHVVALETKLQGLKEKEEKQRSLVSEIAELETKLDQTRQGLETLIAQAEQTRSDHEEALQKKQSLQHELDEFHRDLEVLTSKKTQLENELTDLQSSRTKLLGEAKSLEEKDGQVKSLQAELEKARTGLADLEASREKITAHLRTMDESQTRQTEQLVAMQQENIALLDELNTEKDAKREMEDERNQLELDVTHLEEEKRVLAAALAQQKPGKDSGGAEAFDGAESLTALMTELPRELWQMFGRHYPGGQSSDRFKLTLSFVVDQLTQAWNYSGFFRRIVKNLVLYRSLYRWLQTRPFYQKFKRDMQALGIKEGFDRPGEWIRFKVPGDERTYSLDLSSRDVKYLLRGFISGDCTNCGPGFVTGSFITATGSHIVDPGFFNFELFRDGEWVGNVYAMAMKENGKPVLVIDAIQIPWDGITEHIYIPEAIKPGAKFPVENQAKAFELAEAVIEALKVYANQTAYQELWLSSFFSNFYGIKDHFRNAKGIAGNYDRLTVEAKDQHTQAGELKKKIGGQTAQDDLGYESRVYIESLRNPEAKKVWPNEPAWPNKKPFLKIEPVSKSSPTPASAAVALQVAGKKPEKTVAADQMPAPVLTTPVQTMPISSLKQLVEMIVDGVQFSYERLLSSQEEFIVKIPGKPLRWVAFNVQDLEWKLHEKNGVNARTYRLFEAGRSEPSRGGNIDLSKAEVELAVAKRVPLTQFLEPPPVMPAKDVVMPEAGGFIVQDGKGKLLAMPLSKKGIAPISDIEAKRRGPGIGFFVHPGGIPSLDSKDESLSVPFSTSGYEVLRAQYPNGKFILGWHTNPGGPAKLHAAEEIEMARSGIGGLQLVVTPYELALWDYSGNGDHRTHQGALLFETPRSNPEWSKQLALHLKKFLQPEKISGDEVPGSGYQLRGEGKEFLTEALENGEKSQPRNIKSKIQKLYFDLGTSYGLDVPGLEAFIEQSDFNLVVVKPEHKRNERAPPMGFGIENVGRAGRDVYATFELAPKEGENGFEVTIYVAHGIYELAEEKERLEIIAHELYQAYRIANEENPDEYPIDIDFELKIDEEIRRSDNWEPRIPRDEREDLGLLGGVARRTDAHVRARAFARLLGTPSADGIGTTYTQLLRNAYGLSHRFGAEAPQAEDPLNVIPPPGQDAFRYTQDSFENVVSAEGLQRLFEMSAYVHEHKEEEVTEFLERKIDEGKNVLLLNQNAPTPWILKDTRKIIEGLTSDEKLSEIFLDLPPRIQPLIDQYLRTGRPSQELSEAIASRFPPFLPREFQRPDLYINLLRAIYEYNLEAGNGGKIQVTAYYEGRRLPPMPPGQGQLPPRPGDMPFRQREDRPFQPPFQDRGDLAPPATFPGRDLPFPGGLPLPPLPLTQGVKEAFEKALSDAERKAGSAVLFLKPLDEFFPEELINHPRTASILHIDKYTGYGPEKPENQLALYMSEQASPNQKSFALPILEEAPFFEESINPGLPRGIPFNAFNVYPDLILSTAGDGDENLDLTPNEVEPEVIEPLVPVGGRSEVRIASPEAISLLRQRNDAIRELAQIGEPALGPLLDALTLPSVTVRLGAIQVLGAIGDPRAIAPLNQVSLAVELRQAARLAVQSIRENPKALSLRFKHQEKEREVQTELSSISEPVMDLPLNRTLENLDTEKSVVFVQTLLTNSSLKVDLDVESLVHKENGRVRLTGWGFVEALKVLEEKLPNEFFEKIRIRLVNLNPQIRKDEIERAFGLTPELRRIVEITNVPVRHTAFKGIEPFLEKDALKIASERNEQLWEGHADILVKEPGKEQVIDGRKLFLAALLHRNLRTRISKELRALAIRLLREIGDLSVNGVSYFNVDSRSAFSLEILSQMDQINRMLSSMA